MKKQPFTIKTDDGIFRLHKLKTVDPYFSEVKSGNKTFEIRLYDRDFKVGDYLWLYYYDPQTNKIGEHITRRITYIMTDTPFAREGYCVMGIVEDSIKISF